jgi:Tfp pilus assembly protein PilO
MRWLARLAMQRLGRKGVAGFGLIVATCGFCAGMLLPLDAHILELKAAMSSPYKRQRESVQALRASDPAAELDAFYRSFPGDDALTDLLAKLHGIGDEHGLAMQQAEYRAIEERGPRLGQYRIIIPATATYPQLKQFLAAVLTEMPSLSLDQISLQRRTVTDAQVDVQLQFTLYLRQRT